MLPNVGAWVGRPAPSTDEASDRASIGSPSAVPVPCASTQHIDAALIEAEAGALAVLTHTTSKYGGRPRAFPRLYPLFDCAACLATCIAIGTRIECMASPMKGSHSCDSKGQSQAWEKHHVHAQNECAGALR
eukprot:scaffold24657_cov129-Isochrysis_galbana.AAC.3